MLAAAKEAVAAGPGRSVSAWVNEAMRRQAEIESKLAAMARFIAAYEAEHGVITEEEMRDARRGLGARPSSCGGVRGLVTFVLDAGALVAVERSDPKILAPLKDEILAGRPPLTHGGVIGQVWRGGRDRQAVLAIVLAGVDVAPLDDRLGRRAGVLLGRAGASDVVDAALVLLAADGDEILTSDPDDLRPLAAAAGVHVELVPV